MSRAGADGYVSAGVILSSAVIALGSSVARPIVDRLILALILRATWSSWAAIHCASA